MRIRFALALALVVAAAGPVAAAGDEPEPYLVGFEELPDRLSVGDVYEDARVRALLEPVSVARVAVDDPQALRDRVRDDPAVAYVEPDGRVDALFIPDDPLWGDQYGPAQVEAPGAWNRSLGSTDRAVCTVDTGIRYTHDDLAGARWLGGYDFVHDDPEPWDDQGHGTHVAGIAAAGVDNGVGIAGMGNVGILATKVLDSDGSGTVGDVAEGILWCADHGGDVVSMSIGTTWDFNTIRRAVEEARAEGSLLVSSAGNEGPCTDCITYPAAYDEVMAVPCTNGDEDQCSFSSQGPEAELAAPGRSILSTCVTGDADYCEKSGTSMSAPHVSGAAAAVWTANDTADTERLRTVLQGTAQDLGADGWDAVYGYGELDFAAAMEEIDDLPWACFSVDPALANTSEPVRFDSSCSTDRSTPTEDLEARWDWTADGTWDTAWSTDNATDHPFSTSGRHTVRLQVRDEYGWTNRTERTVLVDDPPDACLEAHPRHGDLLTRFRFDAWCSSDDRTGDTELPVRWDLDGDGTWDTGWTTDKTIRHRYDETGRYNATVQVRDGLDQTATGVAPVTVHLACAGGTCVG